MSEYNGCIGCINYQYMVWNKFMPDGRTATGYCKHDHRRVNHDDDCRNGERTTIDDKLGVNKPDYRKFELYEPENWNRDTGEIEGEKSNIIDAKFITYSFCGIVMSPHIEAVAMMIIDGLDFDATYRINNDSNAEILNLDNEVAIIIREGERRVKGRYKQ